MAYHDDPAPIVKNVKRLRRYAIALLGNTAEAEDLLQECLMRALSRRKPWSKVKNPRAYLFTIMHNLFVDSLAKRQRMGDVVPIDTMENVLSSPAQQFDRITVLETEKAFRSLPGEQQEVLLLIGLEGLSYKEAATILGVPQGTVMSRLSRARKALRDATMIRSAEKENSDDGWETGQAAHLDIERRSDKQNGVGDRNSKECRDELPTGTARSRGVKIRRARIGPRIDH